MAFQRSPTRQWGGPEGPGPGPAAPGPRTQPRRPQTGMPWDPASVPGPDQGPVGLPPGTSPGWNAGPATPPVAKPKPSGPEIENALWNTKGYQAPKWTPESWGSSPLGGFDGGKWGDKNLWNPKYTVGRIMSNYSNFADPEIRGKFMEDISRAYPGAKLDGDMLYLWEGDPGVDIFQGSDAGQWTPQWYVPSMDDSLGGPQDGLGASLEGLLGHLGGQGSGGGGGAPGSFWNQGNVDNRVEAAERALDRYRTKTLANDRSILASRGLAGMGPEISALTGLEGEIADIFGSNLQEIYANAGDQADDLALGYAGIGSGERIAGMQNELGWGRLGVDKMLGLGGLGNQRYGMDLDYSLGLGNLGLGRDRLAFDWQNADMGQLIDLLSLLLRGQQGSQGGYE